ncbi:STAS domain-containing protein [Streptomyces sp. NPDC016675]|jgi:stage II sporulation protein AA (anti-sigma F factor antagonist)|uniref:STAS domain-containing protein n=1 Tax=Streptomyces sp. NPDC016675 TaxID=3364970 RepID=UPI0037006BFF
MAEEQTTDSGRADQTDRLSAVSTVIDGIRVLALAGEIDHDTGGQLRQALDAAGTDRPRIVLDMRQVTFMDSSGINILIAAHQDIATSGGWLRLAAPADAVLRVLRLVGVDQLIDCHSTLNGALTP